mgnify:CR=1 FL=1
MVAEPANRPDVNVNNFYIKRYRSDGGRCQGRPEREGETGGGGLDLALAAVAIGNIVHVIFSGFMACLVDATTFTGDATCVEKSYEKHREARLDRASTLVFLCGNSGPGGFLVEPPGREEDMKSLLVAVAAAAAVAFWSNGSRSDAAADAVSAVPPSLGVVRTTD